MRSSERHVAVKSFAKVNLDLRVLWRRNDGYHEIRSLFHTISLADAMEFRWKPGRGFRVHTDCPGLPIAMEENLAHRAALSLGEAANLRGSLHISIRKRIPAGGGLGGGSSNAASVLLALPVLTGARLPLAALFNLAASLGSDVPFFLMGGAAVGLGRGEELYPAPPWPSLHGLLVAPQVSVSTAAAYRSLSRPILQDSAQNNAFATLVREFTGHFLAPAEMVVRWDGAQLGRNDFEPAVFGEHPELAGWKRTFLEAGATHAMMSGSGSTVFALFPSQREMRSARAMCPPASIHPFQLLSLTRYRREWLRCLAPFAHTELWPPQSSSTVTLSRA